MADQQQEIKIKGDSPCDSPVTPTATKAEEFADEFDRKVEISDQDHHKLRRSGSSSSSSSEEEVGEGGEKKKKKDLKDKISDEETKKEEGKKGFLDKIKEKLPGGKTAEGVNSPPPTPAAALADEKEKESEKKGFLDKIKDKIPGYNNSKE